MRKISFMLLLAFAGTVAVAQTASEYKFQKGNVATELQFAPFSLTVNDDYYDDVSFSTGPFSMPGLRLRYAISEKLVLRATIELDMGHNSYKKNLDDTLNSYYEMEIRTGKETDKSRYTQFAISPGIEYHFGNWERMSPYIGIELAFGMRTTQSKYNVDLTSKYYERDWLTEEWEYHSTEVYKHTAKTKNCQESYWEGYSQNGWMFFGINLGVGMDFYVYKGLYLGAEFGLCYVNAIALKGTSNYNTTVTTSYADGKPDDRIELKDEVKLEDKIDNGNLGFRCNPMIRLGWKF